MSLNTFCVLRPKCRSLNTFCVSLWPQPFSWGGGLVHLLNFLRHFKTWRFGSRLYFHLQVRCISSGGHLTSSYSQSPGTQRFRIAFVTRTALQVKVRLTVHYKELHVVHRTIYRPTCRFIKWNYQNIRIIGLLSGTFTRVILEQKTQTVTQRRIRQTRTATKGLI